MSAFSAPDDTLRACWRRLGISDRLIAERRLPLFADADVLHLAETGSDGREHRLIPPAALAWARMKSAAAAEDIEIFIVSAHRSIERQIEIFERKLDAGQSIERILAVSAPPGCSEHHTGRAVDVGTALSPPLEEAFEQTPAFAWLAGHAERFGFRMSFPRGNPWGYDYEPWHWCFHAPTTPHGAR